MMRVNKTICDNCKKEVKTEDASEWIKTEAIKSWFRVTYLDKKWHGERLDLCCFACFYEFFERLFKGKVD